MKDWDISINYGIKTGCNEAFIIDEAKRAELIRSDPKSAEIIRPILRGRDIKRYGYEWANQYLIVTHNGYRDNSGSDVPPLNINDYQAIKAHLYEHWDAISTRTDRGITPYNLRNCAYMDDFSKQKIVWGNLNLKAQYVLVDEVIYVNAPSPIITPGSEYLLAFLNSAIGDWWIKLVGVGRSGGFLEYKPMFVESFPVPLPTYDVANELSQLVRIRMSTENTVDIAKTENKINQLIFSTYNLTKEEIKEMDELV